MRNKEKQRNSNNIDLLFGKYRDIVEGDLKIIILKEEEKSKIPGKQKVAIIKRLLKQIQEKNIFQNIENPVKWQKAIRY